MHSCDPAYEAQCQPIYKSRSSWPGKEWDKYLIKEMSKSNLFTWCNKRCPIKMHADNYNQKEKRDREEEEKKAS